ncbi:MAG: aldo/keto reductase [Gemmatimonadales bacterium]
MDRRAFAQAGVAALAAGRLGLMGQSQSLERAAIPSSGETIPRIGLGTWQTFDVGADAARRADLAEVLRRFTAAGASVVDSSPMYGSSESVVGDLVQAAGLRDRLFVATKVWTTGREAGIAQMTESARRLRAERIDLMQIHNLVDWETHLRTLRDWKAAGRIRYLGITHYQAAALPRVEAILRAEAIDFVQINLSVEEPEAAARLLPLAADRGVAVIANRPFGGGAALRSVRDRPLPDWAAEYDVGSWAQLLLKWVLSHEAVTCAIPGTGNPRHLDDNLAAARGRRVDAAGRGRIERLWQSL